MDSRIPPVLRPEHPTPRPLALLAQEFELEHHGSLDGVELTGVTLSTQDLHPGDLYVGIRGANSHGAQYAGQAAAAERISAAGSPAAIAKRAWTPAARAGWRNRSAS